MRKVKRAKRQPNATATIAGALSSAAPLDEETRELLDLMARLIARGNFERASAADYFKRCLELAPAATHPVRHEPADQTFLPSEVITQWHNLPEYLSNGQPRRLPAKGRLSIASLVRRLDPHAGSQQILKYLMETRAVERVGHHFFLPTTRIISHRRKPAQQQIHHRRTALALARTLETNARHAELFADELADEPPGDSRIYQFASTGFVPGSQMLEFKKEMHQINDKTLVLVDGVMARLSQKRRRGEQLVSVSEVIFMSEDCPLAPPSPGTPRAPNSRRRKGR